MSADLRSADIERFMAFVSPEPNTGCWLWAGAATSVGYGALSLKGLVLAHRRSWELFRGPIPEGLHIDHKCRVRICVNPDHIEPVTPAENNRRIVSYGANRNTQKTHCPQGHAYSGDNLLFRPARGRGCKACLHEQKARSQRAIRAAKRASR